MRGAWTRVGAATGQPFDMAFFDRASFTYDTEPACRAVVTARRLMPRMALPFKARISRAFYAENRDMTRADEIARGGGGGGLRAPTVRAKHSPRPRRTTRRSVIS